MRSHVQGTCWLWPGARPWAEGTVKLYPDPWPTKLMRKINVYYFKSLSSGEYLNCYEAMDNWNKGFIERPNRVNWPATCSHQWKRMMLVFNWQNLNSSTISYSENRLKKPHRWTRCPLCLIFWFNFCVKCIKQDAWLGRKIVRLYIDIIN